MNNLGAILRTVDGFVVGLNTNPEYKEKGQDCIVLLENNKSMLMFYNDVKKGLAIIEEIKKDFSVNDNIFTIMNKIYTDPRVQEDDSNVAVLGCGFVSNQAQTLGFSSGNPLRPFLPTVTLEKDSIYDFYKELLYNTPSSAEAALTFLGVWFSKAMSMNGSGAYSPIFGVLNFSRGKVLDANECENILSLGQEFHNTVKMESAKLFLEVNA
ncbi:hypothetical protein D3C75_783610 [compost metagenome]